jgi:hypothetical protein
VTSISPSLSFEFLDDELSSSRIGVLGVEKWGMVEERTLRDILPWRTSDSRVYQTQRNKITYSSAIGEPAFPHVDVEVFEGHLMQSLYSSTNTSSQTIQ